MSEGLQTFIGGVLMSLGALALVGGLGLLMAFPVKWCWNYTMPHLFALPTITWGQAWCLNFVAHVLIKSTLRVTK